MFLIADDSTHKIQMLRPIVEREWGGEILIAMTTEDAIDLIDQHPDISAAFIDYYIPKQLGPSVIKYLKGKIPEARCALVTSASSPELAIEAEAAGAETTICTSLEQDVVEEQLVNLIRSWNEPRSRAGSPH